jgi:hypothetical protein
MRSGVSIFFFYAGFRHFQRRNNTQGVSVRLSEVVPHLPQRFISDKIAELKKSGATRLLN